jgi:uncharacterized Tic20 family protein
MRSATEPSSEFVDRPWMEGAAAPAPSPPSMPERAVDDSAKSWRVACHLVPLVLWFAGHSFLPILIPLLIWQVKAKQDSDQRLATTAVEAMNFQIGQLLLIILLAITMVGILAIPFVLVGGVICSVIATVKTANGQDYRYPFTHRFVRDDRI